MIKQRLSAIIWKEEHWYVSLCPQLDIASQGKTLEEARLNLKEAIEMWYESASAEEIASRQQTDEIYLTSLEISHA